MGVFPSSLRPSNGLKSLATIENRVLYAIKQTLTKRADYIAGLRWKFIP